MRAHFFESTFPFGYFLDREIQMPMSSWLFVSQIAHSFFLFPTQQLNRQTTMLPQRREIWRGRIFSSLSRKEDSDYCWIEASLWSSVSLGEAFFCLPTDPPARFLDSSASAEAIIIIIVDPNRLRSPSLLDFDRRPLYQCAPLCPPIVSYPKPADLC